ncbi:TonB-dependent receptor [Sphingomonas sp. MG17]|uniref:TonB-dependent receptor n=1 Tax=Sphingomonas tagetis TaxID=2949092 RepID=A0A9X2HIF4_9SPHN|nr:TonB-dependent receptor [Sphingomonas tagetis]MCP3730547.1 TonB-dependent receptor [Sphingomonas tagetis]
MPNSKLKILALSLVAQVSIGALTAPAVARDSHRSFSIPAQPLATAIIAYSRQSGVAVLAPMNLLAGKTAPAVRGQMPAANALEILLDGSGLRPIAGPKGGIVLAKISAASMSRPVAVVQVRDTPPSPARLAPAPAPASPAPIAEVPEQEIVVTGSIIRGTREDALLPVNVIGGDELQKQGAPSAVELLKALPTSSGVLGDSNPYDSRSQGAEGIATANLRGLSPQRTLVLLNNKRLVTSGNSVPAVDLNLIPTAAIGRIEILKDGAAATYGSDAIAGVLNFITRTDQQGFRASAGYKHVMGTDGDIDASISYGHIGSNFRILAAVGYNKRSELLASDRDFAIRPYLENPQGGWTGGGNPSTFLAVNAAGAPVTAAMPDSSCAALGGFVGANSRCYNQYTPFVSLTDLERRWTAFVDAEVDIAADTKFTVSALYGHSDVPHSRNAPSRLLTQQPSLVAFGGTNPAPGVIGSYVPETNPGFIAYRAANPGALPATATGAVFPLLLFRPYMAGGNPVRLDEPGAPGAGRGQRLSESMRATAELTGKISSDISYSVSATYHDYHRYVDDYDSFGDRVQLALRGFGGPSCNIAANTPGQNGCLWLNPFGNAVTAGAVNGTTNPQGSAALANSRALTDWFYVKATTVVDSRLAVFDANLSGLSGITLPGGEIRFGVGAQYRHSWLDKRYGANNNLATTPCRDTPITGNTNPAACAPLAGTTPSPANGALAFIGSNVNTSLDGGVKAIFAEVQLPVIESVDVQAALRYEDYGGNVGSTTNPQIRARWQATPWLAFRGGYATTFRGPVLDTITGDFITTLQLIGSTFKPVDVFGNPSLKPESATNYSAGMLFKFSGFNASIDYFRYEISDVIVSDPLGAMVSTLFPTGSPNQCAIHPALAARFTFTTPGCTAATTGNDVSRVRTQYQNGATLMSDGIDLSLNYRNNDLLGNGVRFGIGVDATRTLHNKFSDILVDGVTVQRAFDGVGLLNYQSTLYPVPKWKGQAYVDLGKGAIDTRFTVNYTGGLHDQRFDTRAGPYAPDRTVSAAGTSLLQGADIGDFISVDFNLQARLPWNVVLAATVFNIFNVDPPFAREDLNYEPFIGNPYGRMVRVSLSTEF